VKFLLPLFLLLPINLHADEYTQYLKDTWRVAHRYNPTITSKEATAYAWSVWEGCEHSWLASRLYNCLAIKERRFVWIDVQEETYGYTGVTYSCKKRIMRAHRIPKTATRYELNKHFAEQFYYFYINYGPEYAVKQWHREHEMWAILKYNKQAVDYWKEIKKILRYHNGE
jgi:hypothetical protein